jgi:hypothetical protein
LLVKAVGIGRWMMIEGVEDGIKSLSEEDGEVGGNGEVGLGR